MKLSVVILNYNVRYFLELCLKSVEAAIAHIDAEIIVVDNNSPDDSCRMIRDLFPSVKLIENKENSGFSKGNNMGVAEANGDYVCILNPDTVVAEDTFSSLIDFADKTRNFGIIGCRLIDGKGDYLPESKRNTPTPKVSFNKIFGSGNLYYAKHLNERDTGQVDILVGAFMLIEREVYKNIGGFDEDYFMYGEDIDLSYKLLKSGLDNYYLGSQTIIHFKGESTPKNKVYRRRFYEAMRIFYKKHFRRNMLLDLLIYMGTKTIPLLGSNTIKDKSVVKKNEEIIFDSNTMSFKQIIASFEDQSGIFKIRPRNAKFIVGSSSSKLVGEVRQLD